MTTCAAIILARGGSKGLPRKNALPIAGKPCIAWTIEHALATPSITHTAVSSDDPELLDIAQQYGAATIERPANLAADNTTIDDAARHALSTLESQRIHPTHLAILYGNVPVRPADLTEQALQLLLTTGADSVQSYQPVGKHHPWWTAVVQPDGDIRPWQGDLLNHGVFRRQDLPPAHIPDGGVIVLTRAALMLEVPGAPQGPHAFFGAHRRGIINPEGAVIDIDTHTDALVAGAILDRTLKANA